MALFKKKERRDSFFDVNSVDDVLLKALIGGETVDRQKAMEIPAVSSAVDFICNTFAMIPFKLYEETVDEDGKRHTREVADARVDLLNDDTKDTLDGFQFKKAICEDYLLGKGGYAYIKKNRNKFVGLYYVEEKHITIQSNFNPIFKNYDILVNSERFNSFDFLKLLRNTKDGSSGVGVINEINKALQTAYKRLVYDYNLTITGGSRKGFIKSQKKLSKEAIESLKQAWQDYCSGNANTVILNDGLEFQEASNNSRENEINEKDKTFTGQIFELFHIGNSYEETVKNAIMPIATAFATALNRDFLLEKEKNTYYFAPDTKELYRGSLAERYSAYKIAIDTGFKTRNEIRYMEDDDAIEGLDIINLGLGSVLLDAKTGQIYTPNTNQTAQMGNAMPQEARANPYHDEMGRFASNGGGSVGGGSSSGGSGGNSSSGGEGTTKPATQEQLDAFDEAFKNARLLDVENAKEGFETEKALYEKFQEGVATKENFMCNTMAEFKQMSGRPKTPPDYVSRDRNGKVSSEYWYTKDGVIRGSDHWGCGVASCDWALKGKTKDYYGNYMSGKPTLTNKSYGKASWDDFVHKTSRIDIGDGNKYFTTFNTTKGKRASGNVQTINGKNYEYQRLDHKWIETY